MSEERDTWLNVSPQPSDEEMAVIVAAVLSSTRHADVVPEPPKRSAWREAGKRDARRGGDSQIDAISRWE